MRNRTKQGLIGRVGSSNFKPGFTPEEKVKARLEGRVTKKTPTKTLVQKVEARDRISIHQHYSNALSRLEEKRPNRINIGLMSYDEIKKFSVGRIDNPNIAQGVENGINSALFGRTQPDEVCSKCGNFNCQGHFGHIELSEPVLDPLYGNQIIATLKCVCHTCGSILVDERIVENNPIIRKSSGWKRLHEISKIKESVPCSVCENINPKIESKESKKKNYVVVVDSKGKKCNMSASMIYDIFDSIGMYNPNQVLEKDKGKKKRSRKRLSPSDSESDSEDEKPVRKTEKPVDIEKRVARSIALLGFGVNAHPRDMIIRALLVLPQISRPPVFEGDKMRHDYLDLKYKEIIETNNRNEKGRGDKLYNLITELYLGRAQGKNGVDNSIPLLKRLHGKDGVFRAHLMGRRVEFSSRGVISPGGMLLKFGEVGVPRKMASEFTLEETITQTNYGYITSLHEEGKLTTHTPREGRTKKIVQGEDYDFKIGDTVERWLEDGDVVIFNRQPTLHKGGVPAMTVKLIDDWVFRLHQSSTEPSNADFDGDAANILLVRSKEAIKEANEIMHAERNIINEYQNVAMVGLVMDSLTSAAIATRPNLGVDPYIFTDVLSKITTSVNVAELQARAGAFGLHPWSGRTLFSSLFPSDFFYNKGDVVIISGVIVSGQLKKSHLGSGSRTIVQDLHKFYGWKRTSQFITDATFLTLAWLDTRGFTVGLGDCEFGASVRVQKIRQEWRDSINKKLEELGPKPADKILGEDYERKFQEITDTGKFGEELLSEEMDLENNIRIMVESGAKGDTFNVQQIGTWIGQQYYCDKRIQADISKGFRSTPTQPRRDPHKDIIPPEERGYCWSSFFEGLNPEETYNILRGGREGLINTAKSTGKVGEIRREMAKALENVITSGDGSVRSIPGKIISFIYGGDGMNSGELLNVNTKDHGTIPSFTDVSALVAQANAMGGWIDQKYQKNIDENVANAKLVDADIRQQLVRGSEPVNYEYDYN